MVPISWQMVRVQPPLNPLLEKEGRPETAISHVAALKSTKA